MASLLARLTYRRLNPACEPRTPCTSIDFDFVASSLPSPLDQRRVWQVARTGTRQVCHILPTQTVAPRDMTTVVTELIGCLFCRMPMSRGSGG